MLAIALTEASIRAFMTIAHSDTDGFRLEL